MSVSASRPAAGFRSRASRLAASAAQRRQLAVVAAVAALAALYVLLFHDLFTNLGWYWLQDWDESRHIANAMEMLHRGDWVVNTYRGAPDFYNLKPPASFWAIMLSVQAFGVSAFSVRLPSALATLLTCALCTAVSWRWRGPVAAVVTTAAFGSSLHLIDLHSGRTADPDALFILFMTVSVLSGVWASTRPWLLVVATTCFSMAFLTKSYHAVLVLLFVAGVNVVARRRTAVRPRHVLVALAGFAPLVAWAITRASRDGLAFFTAMVQTDVLARSGGVIEGHTGGPDYYLANLQVTFGPWILVLAVALAVVAGGRSWAELRRRVTADPTAWRFVALVVWAVLVFVAFSAAASKLPYYATSAFPELTVLLGVSVAAALPRASRPVMVGVLVASLVAVWLGQLSIMSQRRTEQPIAAQVAISKLRAGQIAPGQPFYVDNVLSGWQQNLVAMVDMFSDAAIVDGFEAGYRSDAASAPVILVQQGSSDYTAAMADHPKVLVADGGWAIVQRTAGPKQ